VTVACGDEYLRLTPRHFQINAARPEDYETVVRAVVHAEGAIDRVLHLMSCDRRERPPASAEDLWAGQRLGVESLLHVVRAVDDAGRASRDIGVTVITRAVAHVVPGEETAFEQAPLLGFSRCVAREMPWIDVRRIDLPAVDVPDIDATAACLKRELEAGGNDTDVAWRDGQRYVSGIEAVDLRAETLAPQPALQAGGLCVVSGGLGGVGFEVSRFVLRHFRARLLILGRSVAPTGASARRLETLAAMGEVLYRAVDVSDEVAVRAAIVEAEGVFGTRLDAVFHLAGELASKPILDLSTDDLARALRPKMIGTWVLDRILAERGGGLFVSFSSVNGIFGGSAVAAYSCANAFQLAYGDFQARHRSFRTHCAAWTMWRGLGMSEGFDETLTRASGFDVLSGREGIQSLEALLVREPFPVLIGLDASSLDMSYLLQGAVVPVHRLAGYFTGNQTAAPPPDALARLAPVDALGRPTSCALVPVDELPNAPAPVGDVSTPTRVNAESVMTVAESVDQLTAIWKALLDLDDVGLDDNFFDLGGHSLLIPKVQRELRATFGRDVDPVDLFRYPTVRTLAAFVSGTSTGRAMRREL
jgi:NADP-dependent 3-hydroxy acid dehydrogenase YdfG